MAMRGKRTLSADRLLDVLKNPAGNRDKSRTGEVEEELRRVRCRQIEQTAYLKTKAAHKTTMYASAKPPIPVSPPRNEASSITSMLSLIQSIAHEERSRSSTHIDSLAHQFNTTVLDIEARAARDVAKAKAALEAEIAAENEEVRQYCRWKGGSGKG